jgi:hypothetical protein
MPVVLKRSLRPQNTTALKLLYVEMGKELNIGEEFNLGCSWARVHGGLEVGRKCLARKMMRADARLSRVVVNYGVHDYRRTVLYCIGF